MGPLDPMKPNPPTAPVDPVLLLIVVVWLAAEALVALLIATLALVLTFAGWRPTQAPVRAAPGADPDVHPLQRLPVVELRRLARAAGHRALARSGRRVELLQALAVAPG